MPAEDRERTRRTVLRAGALLASGALAGPAAASDPSKRPDPSGASEETIRTLTAGNAAFAVELHRRLRDRKDEANLLTSPYSIASAFAMVWAGARNETKTAIADTLKYRLEEAAVHRGFHSLNATLESHERDPKADTSGQRTGASRRNSTNCFSLGRFLGKLCLPLASSAGGPGVGATGGESSERSGSDGTDGELTLDVANALWGQQGYPFEEEYLDVLRQYYGAGVREVEFRSPEGRAAARTRINDWTKENTSGRIETIIPKDGLSKATRFVLTNAIYFKGDWQYPFPEDRTSDEEFTAVDGSSSTVPTMRQRQELPYAAVDGAQVVELPYVGGKLSMVVVLPPEGSFEEFVGELSGEQFQALVGKLTPREGHLELPRFTYRTKARLTKDLPEMGMGVAFSRAADFYGMVREEELPPREKPIRLQDVFHKTFVEVDETGAEAAGVTAIGGGTTTSVGGPEPEPFEMVVDRPFAFAIRERETGAVLFFGQVGDAGAAQ